MQNVEYKAELRDPALARTICGAVGASFVGTLVQTDTYFRVPDARLKRRECVGYETEWVLYRRPNRLQPKLSNFTIYSETQARQRFGENALPVLCVVKKQRDLFMSRDGVRIHLDHVEGLGHFIEFEALICPERSLADARTQLETVKNAFRAAMGEPISSSYADLATGEAAAMQQD